MRPLNSERLLVTQLPQLLGPRQEREMPPLLGLERADPLELKPRSGECVRRRARLPLAGEEQLKKKFSLCFATMVPIPTQTMKP